MSTGGKSISHTTKLFLSTCLAILSFHVTQPVFAEDDPPPMNMIAAPKGAPRRWHASMPVGCYSQVNLLNGRVLTTIPIVSYSGRGPSTVFNLYHNQCSLMNGILPLVYEYELGRGDANGDGQLTESDIDPFIDILTNPDPTEEEIEIVDFSEDGQADGEDLGYLLTNLELLTETSGCEEPDWRHSYSAKVYSTDRSHMVVVRDDGTEDVFTKNGSIFEGPPGVFETLVMESVSPYRWTLTTKHQIRAHFYGNAEGVLAGKLDWISDASLDGTDPPQPANKLTCQYDSNGLLTNVVDAGGDRSLTLEYNTNSLLKSVADPGNVRTWRLFRYDATAPTVPSEDGTYLVEVRDPMYNENDPDRYRVHFAYDTSWNISAISDKENHITSLGYTDGRLTLITDPDPIYSNDNPLTQSLAYVGTYDGFLRTQYNDRRAKAWYYYFDTVHQNFSKIKDPLLHVQRFEYTESDALMHEITLYINAIDQPWATLHDSAGNVINRFDPLGHKWQWDYDGLNNLVSITPPDDQGNLNYDKQVRIDYEDVLHPTSPTTITHPDTDQSEPVVTTISYYDGTHMDWYGLVKGLTDPNGVLTEFQYDNYGQFNTETGGKLPPSLVGSPELYVYNSTCNPNGTPTSASGPNGGGTIGSDANGRPTGQSCLIATTETPPQPNDGSAWGTPRFPGMVDAKMTMCGAYVGYDAMDNVISGGNCVWDPFLQESSGRAHEIEAHYDELQQRRNRTFTTYEPQYGHPWTREFTYLPDWANAEFDRTGPDGQLTSTILDDAGRVVSVDRNGIATQYDYDDANRLTQVINSNGTETIITYDYANRVTSVHDKVSGGSTILKREFTDYSPDGLIRQIDEYETSGTTPTASLIYYYDNLNRLTFEGRDGYPGVSYYLEYTYDAGGNRRTKTDWGSPTFTETVYTYDNDDPSGLHGPDYFGSNDNRLLRYDVHDLDQEGEPIVETVWYTYHVTDHPDYYTGNVRQIIRKIEGDDTYYRIYFTYDNAGRVWIVARDEFEWDGNSAHEAEITAYVSAREFRYDGTGRRRYVVRDRNPETLAPLTQPSSQDFDLASGTWTDYDGETVYGDYTLSLNGSTLTATRTADHMPGIYQTTAQTSGDESNWYHTDQVGTTRAMTDESHAVSNRAIYTAFGELVDQNGSISTRYGFCGAFGYEGGSGTWGTSPSDQGLIHAGTRMYDPSIGRFLQRDPIGVRGGLNVYRYARNRPTSKIDPSGFSPEEEGFLPEWWDEEEIEPETPDVMCPPATVFDDTPEVIGEGLRQAPVSWTEVGQAIKDNGKTGVTIGETGAACAALIAATGDEPVAIATGAAASVCWLGGKACEVAGNLIIYLDE